MLAKTSIVCPLFISVFQTMVAIRATISYPMNRTLDLRDLYRLRFCIGIRFGPAGIRALGLLLNWVSVHWQAYMDRSIMLHMLAEIEALAAFVVLGA